MICWFRISVFTRISDNDSVDIENNITSVVDSLAFTYYQFDLAPIMTSDNAPAPYVASASSTYSGTYPAWRAFDGIPESNNWASANGSFYPGDIGSEWLKIDLAVPQLYNAYYLCNREGAGGAVDFTVEGSNDDNNWTVIDNVTGRDGSAQGLWTSHVILSQGYYRYYRMVVTRITTTGSSNINIGQWTLFYSSLV